MKKNIFLKILAVAGIIVLAGNIIYFASPARSQQGAYFSDEFNLGSYNWSSVRGNWMVDDGEYTETTLIDTATNWSTAGSLSWTDYSVQVQVYSTGTSGKFILAGRWQDEKNYYGLEYSSDGTGAAGANSATYTLYSMKNGVRYNLTEMKRSTDPNVPYIGEGAADVANNPYPAVFKIKFKGSNITVYVNDVQIGYTADTSVNYGKIALGEYNANQVYFDNIFVWDVTEPTLSKITAKEVTGTAATISFSTSESASYRIDFGTTTGYGSFKTQTTRDFNHEVDLTGLELSTTYHYKITATDAAGNQTVSDDYTFTTASTLDTVAPSVYSISASDIAADAATINWTSDESANSIVDYGTQPGVYKWSLSYDARVTSHAVFLKKLEPLTTYYYRVKSRDLSGNLGISGEYSFTTLNNLKPKITAVRTGSDPAPATTVNVAVYWKDVPEAVSYKVYVSTTNDWSSPVATYTDTAGKTSYSHVQTDLTAYTNYFIRVYAIDSEGNNGYSAARAFPPSTNPHGFYWDNPDLCGNCHYTHSALGPRLLSEVNADRMCITCHDGTQSKYDVINGKLLGPTSDMTKDENGVWADASRVTWYDSIAGPYGSIAGGTVANSAYTPTSRHDLNIYNYAAPGNNIENVEVADANLSCSSCHDPHGSDNYRNLKTNMGVLNSANPPLITMEAYPVTDSANHRENTIYVSGAVEFCGACHSDFNQSAGASRNAISTTDQPGMTLSNSSMHMFMHPVNVKAEYVTKTAYTVPTPGYLPYENGNIICQTCHYTHGTTNTGTHYRRDGFYSTVMKRFDKNNGCEDCHDKTNHPD